MLRFPKVNPRPRRNPQLTWHQGGRPPKDYISIEHTGALKIPRITSEHFPGVSDPPETGLFVGEVKGYKRRARRGKPAGVEFAASLTLFLPASAAGLESNWPSLIQAQVGFEPMPYDYLWSMLSERERLWDEEHYVSVMTPRYGAEHVAEMLKYLRPSQRELVQIGNQEGFDTAEEARAWVQGKVDLLSRLPLKRY